MQFVQNSYQKIEPTVLTLLRVTVGTVFLLKGIAKLQGIDGVTGMLSGIGFPLPEAFAWILALLETVGGGLLILGLLTPFVGVALFVNMLIALLTVHIPNEGFGANTTGTWFVILLGLNSLVLGANSQKSYGLDKFIFKKK